MHLQTDDAVVLRRVASEPFEPREDGLIDRRDAQFHIEDVRRPLE